MLADPKAFLASLYGAAVDAVSAETRLPAFLPKRPAGRLLVVGAGKGAAAMAKAVESHYDGPLQGLVVTRYGHGLPTDRIEVIEAAHPVPDIAGQRAAWRIMDAVRELTVNDLLLCLISGGGSSLLALPCPDVTLDDKRAVTQELLASGASIHEINCVRKHLSAIKGGRLAAASAAPVLTLAVSDVPGDDPSVIASGPTVADPTTLAEARAVLRSYGVHPPERVLRALQDPANETPKPGDLEHSEFHIIAKPADALTAAAQAAWQAGVKPVILGDAIEGEAREVALQHAALVKRLQDRPAVILSGGETTVTVRGDGHGGRNQEYLLALGLRLDGQAGTYALACDTDGIDGTDEAAGALWTPDSLARARSLGLDAQAMLDDNDAHGFFQKLDDLVVTGPTRTNVNDFRAILVV